MCSGYPTFETPLMGYKKTVDNLPFSPNILRMSRLHHGNERPGEYRTGNGSHPDRTGGSGALTGSALWKKQLSKGGSMKKDRNPESRAENSVSSASHVGRAGRNLKG